LSVLNEHGLQKQTGVQTIAAKDGMIINPLSYAIDKGQRTLVSFPKKKGVEITEVKKEESKQKEPEPEQKEPEPQLSKEPEPKEEITKEPEPQETPEEQQTVEEPEEVLGSEKTLKDIFLQEESKEETNQ